MGSAPGEILFETRRHASGNYTSNYPPLRRQPSSDGGGGSFLSYLTPRGIIQIKERWTGNKNRKKSRYAALIISPHADHVAVVSMNQITFLHKDSGYQEPIGVFTSGHNGTFTCGMWSEAHDVLGVVDDSNTLYFIKANGQEITRISGQHLKVSVPILDLIFQDDNDSKKPCLCTFSILTSDGLLQDIEISQDLSASFLASNLSHTGVMLKKQFPKNISCMDYHLKLSMFASVSCDGRLSFSKAEDPGICNLSLWRRGSSSILELMVSIEFDGSYSEEQSYPGRFSAQEYQKFRSSPVNEAATVLAESGKIGALNLLFKRHPYSLSPFLLEILDAIPETVPVKSYAHLLTGSSPPASIVTRGEDWVETARFLSGDSDYIEAVIFSLIESVKLEKKYILTDMLKLADTFGVDHSKVLLSFLSTVFISDVWTIDDITAELSVYKNELITSAEDVIKVIKLSIYPMIDGHDKLRLAFMYDLLSECYLQLDDQVISRQELCLFMSRIFPVFI